MQTTLERDIVPEDLRHDLVLVLNLTRYCRQVLTDTIKLLKALPELSASKTIIEEVVVVLRQQLKL